MSRYSSSVCHVMFRQNILSNPISALLTCRMFPVCKTLTSLAYHSLNLAWKIPTDLLLGDVIYNMVGVALMGSLLLCSTAIGAVICRERSGVSSAIREGGFFAAQESMEHDEGEPSLVGMVRDEANETLKYAIPLALMSSALCKRDVFESRVSTPLWEYDSGRFCLADRMMGLTAPTKYVADIIDTSAHTSALTPINDIMGWGHVIGHWFEFFTPIAKILSVRGYGFEQAMGEYFNNLKEIPSKNPLVYLATLGAEYMAPEYTQSAKSLIESGFQGCRGWALRIAQQVATEAGVQRLHVA